MVYRREAEKPESSLPDEVERIGAEVVDAAYSVHSSLGPGLLESVYEACMVHELQKRGLGVGTQVPMPVVYDGVQLEVGFRADVVVGGKVLVELKSVAETTGLHRAQVWTYLKLSGIQLGYLVNFNVRLIRDGIRRVVRDVP